MQQPTFELEQEYWQQGLKYIAGVDEVGMGAWAGPVCAAAVVISPALHQTPSSSPLSGGGVAKKVNDEIGFLPYNNNLIEVARENRAKPTPAEKEMWKVLRQGNIMGYKFTQQKPLDNFIADYYCASLLLVIEVDGEYHDGNQEYDDLRTDKLEDYGIKVIRFKNNEIVLDLESIEEKIKNLVVRRATELVSPPDKGGLGGFAGELEGVWGGVAIRDSKTLSPAQRERADEWIKKHARAWAVGEASVAEVDRLNIKRAAQLAMRRAVDGLKVRPEMLLVDGTEDNIHDQIPAIGVVGGDAKVFSIAAASIIAKVYRDKLMNKLDGLYPGYGLAQHKGYGTKQHKEALMRLGAAVCHRHSYAPIANLALLA